MQPRRKVDPTLKAALSDSRPIILTLSGDLIHESPGPNLQDSAPHHNQILFPILHELEQTELAPDRQDTLLNSLH